MQEQTAKNVLKRETNPVSRRLGKASPARVRQVYQAASASSVGLELGLAVVIGWAIGHWLDGKFGTDPLLMLVFLLLGLAAGFKGVLRVANQIKRDAAVEAGEAKAACEESK